MTEREWVEIGCGILMLAFVIGILRVLYVHIKINRRIREARRFNRKLSEYAKDAMNTWPEEGE